MCLDRVDRDVHLLGVAGHARQVLEHHQLPIRERLCQPGIRPTSVVRQIREDLVGEAGPGRVRGDGAADQPRHPLAVEQREQAPKTFLVGQRDGTLDRCCGAKVLSRGIRRKRGDEPRFNLSAPVCCRSRTGATTRFGDLGLAVEDERPPLAGTLLVTDGGLLVTDYKLTQSCFCVSFGQVQFRLPQDLTTAQAAPVAASLRSRV